MWHERMGHPSLEAMQQLSKSALGFKLTGPTTCECDACGMAKITQQISRRVIANKQLTPFSRIHIDWEDLAEGWGEAEEDQLVKRVMFCVDEATGYVTAEAVVTSKEDENLPLVKDIVEWITNHENRKVRYLRTDNEMNRTQTRQWCREKGIKLELSTPDNHSQNPIAERIGGVVMAKARAMRLSSRLPHRLWKFIVGAAVYLYNRTPRRYTTEKGRIWSTPIEQLREATWDHTVTGPRAPQIAHLRRYGCKCFVQKKPSQSDFPARKQKLDSRAHIGYLVGYDSTNIFWVWVPYKKRVLRVRDVIFDEGRLYNADQVAPTSEEAAELEEAIRYVEVHDQEAENMKEVEDQESQDTATLYTSARFEPIIDLEEDAEVVISDSDSLEGRSHDSDGDTIEEGGVEDWYRSPPESPGRQQGTSEAVVNLATELQGNWAEAEGVDKELAAIFNTLRVDPASTQQGSAGMEPAILDEIRDRRTNRFYDFERRRVATKWQQAFLEGSREKPTTRVSDLPLPPQSYNELKNHPLRRAFEVAMKEHLEQHEKDFKSWTEHPRSIAKGKQVIHSMWVFTYKDDEGVFTKPKARLVVCGNQQHAGDLPTRATTLAANSLRILLAITAQFDLDTTQLDAVNAFVQANIDEEVYMKYPPGCEKEGMVLRLEKALYGLRRSPLIWQRTFTTALSQLGFKEVPQEPCVMVLHGVIAFFYVDDIAFCYHKGSSEVVAGIKKELHRRFKLEEKGELRWFLGMSIARDRVARKLWLSQESYIDKVAHTFGLANVDWRTDIPMTGELMPFEGEATETSRLSYQAKVGSILYAAISTRPDIAFAAARLSRFNSNPGTEHHRAADQVILYLASTKQLGIEYGNVDSGAKSFVCSSDASFADNTLDRKSSQGYLITLFGGPIAWRANKQDTVTTSSTEAELLALTQTAKECIYLYRLMESLQLHLNEGLTIMCDNKQTIRLLVEEAARLQTKLRHIDIHTHWLRQEVQRGTVHISWVPTNQMLADGLTKALPRQQFEKFREMINLTDTSQPTNRNLQVIQGRVVANQRIRQLTHGEDLKVVPSGEKWKDRKPISQGSYLRLF
ncbi:hypothetical protein JX266_013452 [Neoarthrinium moseri]|nr:hypothetical protein JX266_013452 [Neoarthrinium moseri]